MGLRSVRHALAIMLICESAGALAEGRTIASPSPGQRATISVGDSLYKAERHDFVTLRIASLRGELQRKIYLVDRIDLPFGTELVEDGAGGRQACTRGTGYKDHGGFERTICLRDIDGDGDFDQLYGPPIVRDVDLKQSIPYETKQIAERTPNSQFVSTLTYSGAAGGALRLSYREFANDLARPAFTEDLSIPLATSFPQIVAVKGVRFRLYKLDGEGVEYEVLPPS